MHFIVLQGLETGLATLERRYVSKGGRVVESEFSRFSYKRFEPDDHDVREKESLVVLVDPEDKIMYVFDQEQVELQKIGSAAEKRLLRYEVLS